MNNIQLYDIFLIVAKNLKIFQWTNFQRLFLAIKYLNLFLINCFSTA
jgi:hypothetical protein